MLGKEERPTSALTPIDKLVRNYQTQQIVRPYTQRTPIILLATGSFSPIHRMYLKMFELARGHLEQKHGAHVVAGYLSPSPDCYVRQKLGKHYIEEEHRVSMCELAVNQSPWLMVDKWEAQQPRFVAYWKVVDHLKAIVSKIIPTAKVMYLMGADLLCRAPHLAHKLVKEGVVCIGRPEYTSKAKKIFEETAEECNHEVEQMSRHEAPSIPMARVLPFSLATPPRSSLYIVDEAEDGVSSTAIRSKLRKGEPIDDLVPLGVGEYIRKNGIQKMYEDMEEDAEIALSRAKRLRPSAPIFTVPFLASRPI